MALTRCFMKSSCQQHAYPVALLLTNPRPCLQLTNQLWRPQTLNRVCEESRLCGSRFISNTSHLYDLGSQTRSTEKVDEGEGSWKEIYHGILTTQIRLVKTFSLCTSALGILAQPVLAGVILRQDIGLMIAIGSFVGFFTFVTPVLIHWISKKYVTRLEYDERSDTYSATTISFFLREKKTFFAVNDVQVPVVPGMFTTFHAKRTPLFVDPRLFSDLDHYSRLMGYDKPFEDKFKDLNEK